MDTLKRVKKELKNRLVLPVVNTIKVRTHPKVTDKCSSPFKSVITAFNSNSNLHDTKQYDNDTKEETFSFSHRQLHDKVNNEIRLKIPIKLHRVEKFKSEIYNDITYLIKIYEITSDESSNDNDPILSYVNDAFSKILDTSTPQINESNKIYKKIKEVFSPQFAIEIYAALLQILILYETSTISIFQWLENFSSEAELILKLYSEYQSIDEPFISYAKWIAYTEINQFDAINPDVFGKILDNLIIKHKNNSKTKKIKTKIFRKFKSKSSTEKSQNSYTYTLNLPLKCFEDEAKHSTEITKEVIHKEEISEIFWNSTKDLIKSFFDFIHELHFTLANGNSNQDLEILEKTAILLQRLVRIDQNKLEEFDFENQFKKAFTDGTVDFIIKNINYSLLAESDKNIERMDELINILKSAVDYIKQFDEKFGLIVKSNFNISIPELLFHAYDSHLISLVHPIISETCNLIEDKFKLHSNENEECFSKVFEFYHEIKKFSNQSRDDFEVHDLKLLNNSQDWILAGIDTWRRASNIKVLFRIEKSIEVDKLKPEFENSTYSSSAIDTMQILFSTKSFWEKLELFDKRENLYEEVTYDLCCSVALYTEKFIETSRNCSEVEDNPLNFLSCIKLVIANHIYIWDNFQNLVQELCGKSRFDENEIQGHIKRTEASIHDEIFDYISLELKKFRPIIQQAALKNVSENSINQIKSTLNSMQNKMSASKFEEIVEIFRNNILDAFADVMQKAINEKLGQEFFTNLHQIFVKLITIFDSMNNSSVEKTEEENVKLIKYKLQCYGQETDQLIHQYYKDRYNIQKNSSNDNLTSALTIFCCFIDDTLQIEILNARNLPVNEMNKKCDSFVKVKLIPEQKFPNFENFKTKVQYDTIYPLYDEKFQRSLTKEQQNIKDAIVHFSVKEKGLVTGDSCLAEAFLSFEDIPQVSVHEKLQQTRMILTKRQNCETESLKAIHYRSQMGDIKAMEFLKKLGLLPRASLMIKQLYLNIRKSPKF